jgi:hypothetical protein
MRGNASYSKTLEMKLPKMINTNFEPHFSLKHMLKDIQIAARMGSSFHLELPVTVMTRDRLLEQMQLGRGDEDYSALARKYFASAQPSPPEEPALSFFDIETPHTGPPQVTGETFPDTTSSDRQENFLSVVPETVPPPSAPAPEPAAPLPELTPIAPLAEERTSQPQKRDGEKQHSERSFLSRLLRRED